MHRKYWRSHIENLHSVFSDKHCDRAAAAQIDSSEFSRLPARAVFVESRSAFCDEFSVRFVGVALSACASELRQADAPAHLSSVHRFKGARPFRFYTCVDIGAQESAVCQTPLQRRGTFKISPSPFGEGERPPKADKGVRRKTPNHSKVSVGLILRQYPLDEHRLTPNPSPKERDFQNLPLSILERENVRQAKGGQGGEAKNSESLKGFCRVNKSSLRLYSERQRFHAAESPSAFVSAMSVLLTSIHAFHSGEGARRAG